MGWRERVRRSGVSGWNEGKDPVLGTRPGWSRVGGLCRVLDI